MSGPPIVDAEPVTSPQQLADYCAAGCKPPNRWRIGTEYEKFIYRVDDLSPAPYEGPQGIAALLEALRAYGWEAVFEHGRIVGLSQGQCAITLEPSGQLELSGAPRRTLHHTCAETGTHLRQLRAVTEGLGLDFLGLGFEPRSPREAMPWMPKGRYALMRRYLPRKGGHGLDMMLRTCAIQVNLDYASEADMARKYRIGLALQPIVTALFAASPFAEGGPSGYLSYRAQVWCDTDPDRCGIPAFVFDEGFGFERYVEHVLDVPMLFVYRDGEYLDPDGRTFRDFLRGRLPCLPGERPTVGDWVEHLTTLFWDVRMKRFLEIRGADGGPQRQVCALGALWVGLLYDTDALQAAWALVGDWRHDEVETLSRAVPRLALHTRFRGIPLQDIALEALAIAEHGLRRRARIGADGRDESKYLDPLWEIAGSGCSRAEALLDAYAGEWGGSVEPLMRTPADVP